MNTANNSHSVECTVHGLQQWVQPKRIGFNASVDLQTQIHGALGPRGISTTAADLIDFSCAVCQIERLLGGRSKINRPEQIELRMQVRNIDAWSTNAVQTSEDILHLLGNATWKLVFSYAMLDQSACIIRSNRRQQNTASSREDAVWVSRIRSV